MLVVLGGLVQTCGVGLQQRCHLVDEGAGTSGADTVHPLLQTALEIDDLGILAAKLDGHIGLRSHRFQGRGHRHDLLHKVNIQCFAKIDGAGAGDLHLQPARSDLLLCRAQQGIQRSLGMCMVTAVITKQDFILLVQNHQFHGGGADIDAGTISIHCVASFSIRYFSNYIV